MAYAILGFAVLHAITRGMVSRSVLLAGTYAAAFVFGLAGPRHARCWAWWRPSSTFAAALRESAVRRRYEPDE